MNTSLDSLFDVIGNAGYPSFGTVADKKELGPGFKRGTWLFTRACLKHVTLPQGKELWVLFLTDGHMIEIVEVHTTKESAMMRSADQLGEGHFSSCVFFSFDYYCASALDCVCHQFDSVQYDDEMIYAIEFDDSLRNHLGYVAPED